MEPRRHILAFAIFRHLLGLRNKDCEFWCTVSTKTAEGESVLVQFGARLQERRECPCGAGIRLLGQLTVTSKKSWAAHVFVGVDEVRVLDILVNLQQIRRLEAENLDLCGSISIDACGE